MKRVFNIIGIGIIIIVVIFLQHRYFPRIENQTVVIHDTVRDTTEIVKYYPKPIPYYIDTGKTDTLILPADSAEITRKYIELHSLYYSKTYYNDTLLNDTSALIVIKEFTFKNEINNRQLNFINRRPTAINTTINNTILSQRQLYFGAEFGINSFEPGIMYKGKNDIQLKLSYELLNNNGLRAGIYITPQSIKKLIK